MDTSLIRKILFYCLILLTISFIYVLFFPKKSYVLDKLDGELDPIITENFNQNINSILIASTAFFENNDTNLVTVRELINNNLLTELKDSNNNLCDSETSYAEEKNGKVVISLNCPNKQDVVIKELETKVEHEKLLCLYEYQKEASESYTEWSDFSPWQKEEVLSDELTNVEVKVEAETDGTKIVTNSHEINIDATLKTRLACPSGYYEQDSKCKGEVYLNTIDASVTYTCPSGYTRSGMSCYNNGTSVSATKKYYCSNYDNLELKLNGSTCEVYRVHYINSTSNEQYYTCPSGYNLSGNKCYKTEYYETEVENYKDVTYYRYQTREKIILKYEIKWSKPNNKDLLDDGFVMQKKITCEI